MNSPSDITIEDRPISVGKLAAALAKAQAEMTGAKKDSENPFFHSHYADLASVWEACRGPLSKNELAVIQTTEPVQGALFLVTTLAHSSGERMTGYLPIVPAKDRDPQALGSAITYARRYALAAIVGVAPEDDDGEAAMARPQAQERGTAAKGGKPPSKGSKALDALVDAQEPNPLVDELVNRITGEVTPTKSPEPGSTPPPGPSEGALLMQEREGVPFAAAKWQARADRELEVAMTVQCGYWADWADQPIPAGHGIAKRAKTWREASEGKKGGGRHALLLDLVLKARKLPQHEVTQAHEHAVCTLAVLLAKAGNPDPKGKKQPVQPELPITS